MSPTRAALQTSLSTRLGSVAEARWMLDGVVGRQGTAAPVLTDGQVAALDALVTRRLAGESLQYVLGTWAFRTLELAVDHRALIPRPETEQVVEAALAGLRRRVSRTGTAPGGTGGPLVADLGTGTGAIALSIAAETAGQLPDLRVWATDADPGALDLARYNLARVAADHPPMAGRVTLGTGPWFDALPVHLRGRLDLVVSNPPYVAHEEWSGLDPVVRAWRQPRRALVAGPGSDGTPGLADVEAVLAGARDWLAPGGLAVVELAPHQAAPAVALARALGYRRVDVARDLCGRDRAVVADA